MSAPSCNLCLGVRQVPLAKPLDVGIGPIRLTGKPLVVVLIPGLGATYHTYDMMLPYLNDADVDYIVVEPPGFGWRLPAVAGITLGSAADCAVTALEEKLPPGVQVLIAGHSAGVPEGIEIARKLGSSGHKVVGFVSINGIVDAVSDTLTHPFLMWAVHPRKWIRMAILMLFLAGPMPAWYLKRIATAGSWWTWLFWPMVRRPCQLSQDVLNIIVYQNRSPGSWQHMWANRKDDFASYARRVYWPFLALAGSIDPLATKLSKSRFWAAVHLMRKEYREIPAGHCLPLEEPQWVAAQIIEFAQRLTSST